MAAPSTRRSVRERGKQRQNLTANDAAPYVAQSPAVGSASALGFFAQEQDFQGHGDQFSGFSHKGGYDSISSMQPDVLSPHSVSPSTLLAPDDRLGTDQILDSPLQNTLDQQRSDLPSAFEQPGFFEQAFPQDPKDDPITAPEPWNAIPERRTMSRPQPSSLMPPPPHKRLKKTDSGYSTTTTPQPQHQTRRSKSSVVSAPAAHAYAEPPTSYLQQNPLYPAQVYSTPFADPMSGALAGMAQNETPVATRSDAGHRRTGPSRNTRARMSTTPQKHRHKSERPFHCDFPECKYSLQGFSSRMDLSRHRKTAHKIILPSDNLWRCLVQDCSKSFKRWPRRDNFRNHLKQVHKLSESEADEFVKRSEELEMLEKESNEGDVQSDPFADTIEPSEMHKSFDPQLVQTPDTKMNMSTTMRASHPADVVKFDSQPAILRRKGFPAVRSRVKDKDAQFDGGSLKQLPRRKNDEGESFYNFEAGSTSPLPSRGPEAQQGDSFVAAAMQDTLYAQTFSLGFVPPSGMRPLPDKAFASRSVIGPDELAALQQRLEYEQGANFETAKSNGDGYSNADFAAMGSSMEPTPWSRFVNDLDGSAPSQVGDIFLSADHNSQRQNLLAADMSTMTLDQIMKLSPHERTPFARMLLPTNAQVIMTPQPKPDHYPGNVDGTIPLMSYQCQRTIQTQNGLEMRCPKTFKKPAELRKHERRHDRKFGCTFDCQDKRFGTKHEWKRHEQNQHIQQECWRCDLLDGGMACVYVFREKADFKTHLSENHGLGDGAITDKLIQCRIAKKFQGQFWCGFCRAIIQNDARMGMDREKKRYDHITSHLNTGSRMTQYVTLGKSGRVLSMAFSNDAITENNEGEDSTSDDEHDEDDNNEADEEDQEQIHRPVKAMVSPITISEPEEVLPSSSSNTTFQEMSPVGLYQTSSFHPLQYAQNINPNLLSPASAQRPRASSDSGQRLLQTAPLFLCCQCTWGPQRMSQLCKCQICGHSLPCMSCFKYSPNQRGMGNIPYVNESVMSPNNTARIRIDEDVVMND